MAGAFSVSGRALDRLWQRVEEILLVSFPPEELGSTEAVRAQIEFGTRVLWLDDPQQPDAVAVTCDLGTAPGDVLLEFLAVAPSVRSTGRGSSLLRAVLATLQRPVVLEVEDPELVGSPEATRRIAFYQRLGGKVLDCARGYAMPNLATGIGEQPMLLIEMDSARASELRGVELRKLVTAIWTVAYSRLEEDKNLQAVRARLHC